MAIRRLKPFFALGLVWTVASILTPSLLLGQGAAQDAMVVFPADTQQITYSNLSELRDLPNYQVIRYRLINPEIQHIELFLTSMGLSPERNIDEVVLGWRGDLANSSSFFGYAEGQFDSEKALEYLAKHPAATSHYGGFDLYAADSAEGGGGIFLTFLSSSSLAFGPLNDLKAMIDARAGGPALTSHSDFTDWESELEGTAPQWGIATGKAAANEAAPWLVGKEKLPIDPQALLSPIKAVLYRVNWDSGISTRISILCSDSQSAEALSKLIALWQASQPAGSSPAMTSYLQGLSIQTENNRVIMSGSAPLEVIAEVVHGPQSAPPRQP